jgi:Tat protein secretion system quality control protein TatD with DNase activity
MDIEDEAYFIPDYDESMLEVEEREECSEMVEPVEKPVQKLSHKSSKKKKCSVCEGEVKNLRRHMGQSHLPWYFYPEVSCWACSSYQGSLCFLRHRHLSTSVCSTGSFSEENIILWLSLMFGLLCTVVNVLCLDSIQDLLPFILEQQWFQASSVSPVSDCREVLLSLLDNFMGFPSVSKHIVSPPNAISSLLHWEIFQIILQHLDIGDQEIIRLSSTLMNSGYSICKVVADGHLHLSRVFSTFKVTGIDQLNPGFDQSAKYMTCISNCVFPTCRKNYSRLLQDHRVFLTFGQHPRFPESFNYAEIENLIQLPRCVGVGECGFDFSSGSYNYDQQVVVFKQHVSLSVQYSKTLVLHLRPGGTFSLNSVYEEALTILRSFLPKYHPVYVHCFTGSYDIIDRWSLAFPNILFGISSKLFHSSILEESVAKLPLCRMALETDSPYMNSSPWSILEIAAYVGKIKNLPQSAILLANYRNICSIYNLI